ncbi:unnamed protein product [Prunus armeniaca]|uniref:Uncharacterized protein n=1 Tax=Prunus armeniaca TaxID=36596 RepID=A0A6J5XXW2_PRUAR|nr:unnamed protein product [Prunus armeniaca]
MGNLGSNRNQYMTISVLENVEKKFVSYTWRGRIGQKRPSSIPLTSGRKWQVVVYEGGNQSTTITKAVSFFPPIPKYPLYFNLFAKSPSLKASDLPEEIDPGLGFIGLSITDKKEPNRGGGKIKALWLQTPIADSGLGLSFEAVVQNLMNSQSTCRNQRPKGLKMKYSHEKAYSGSAENKVSEERGSDILGRKGNAGWSKDGGIFGLEDVNLVEGSIKKEDGGVGDDMLGENAEENNEAESNKVDDHARGKLARHEGNEIERTEMQYKVLNITDDNSDVEDKGNDEPVGLNKNSLQEENSQERHGDTQEIISDHDGEKYVKNISHDEVGEEKEQNSQVNHDKQENEKDREKEPQRLEEFSTNKDISVQHSQGKSDNLKGPDSVVDGVHGFNDENGVPVDGNDLIESIVTGSSDDHAMVLHQEMNSSSNNQSETKENTMKEEVAAKEGTNGADFEAKSKISVEDSKINMKPKVETSSGIGGHANTSRIDSVSETTQGGSSVSDS